MEVAGLQGIVWTRMRWILCQRCLWVLRGVRVRCASPILSSDLPPFLFSGSC